MKFHLHHRRAIMAIALPAIVSNITTPILGLVDTAIAGHMGAAVYLGAIAVGSSMFNMLYWLCNFLRMGTSGMTAQAFGASDRALQARILWRAIALGLVLAAAMLAARGLIADTILRFMDADGATRELARHYFDICILGAPAVMTSLGVGGWLLGMQNSRATMWIAIATNVVNIAVSASLVYGAGWKIEGVATGTVAAQWCGALLGLAIILVKYRPRRQSLRDVFERRALSGFFRINTDIMLRTACLVAVTLWFTHAGAVLGTTTLAANALLLQLFTLFSFFMDGFAFAGEALAGRFHGSGRHDALQGLVSDLLRIGLWCGLLFAAIYATVGGDFVDILADDDDVVGLARSLMPWAVAVPLCGYAAFAWDGILIGLTMTRSMLAAMASAMAVFFLLYFLLHSRLGNNALWLAFNAYLLVRGVAEWFLYRRREGRSSAPS